MRILKSLDRIPERVDLLCAVILDIVDGRGFVDRLTVIEDLNKELSCLVILKCLGLPCLNGIEDLIGLTGRDLFACNEQDISHSLAGCLVVESYDLLIAGSRDLAGILGDLHLGDNITVLILDCSDLINASEYGFCLGRDKPLTYTEGIYACALTDKVSDEIFVESIGYCDLTVCKSCCCQ